MITAAQLRAARGLIDWTRNDLAKAANVSPETIKNIEHGIFRPQEETAERITRTFAAHGVEFTDNEGVKKHSGGLVNLKGQEGLKAFMDDIYKDAKLGKADICISGVNEDDFIKHLGADFADMHIARMTELADVKVRCLIREKDSNTYCNSYNEYRCVPEEFFSAVPFYVYGDKFAVVIFDKGGVMIVVIESDLVAAAYRKQFEVIWKNGKNANLSGPSKVRRI